MLIRKVASELGLRQPGFQFWILCQLIHLTILRGALLAQFSLYVTKDGL